MNPCSNFFSIPYRTNPLHFFRVKLSQLVIPSWISPCSNISKWNCHHQPRSLTGPQFARHMDWTPSNYFLELRSPIKSSTFPPVLTAHCLLSIPTSLKTFWRTSFPRTNFSTSGVSIVAFVEQRTSKTSKFCTSTYVEHILEKRPHADLCDSLTISYDRSRLIQHLKNHHGADEAGCTAELKKSDDQNQNELQVFNELLAKTCALLGIKSEYSDLSD